jgi:Fe-S-cluster containining protein
MAGTFQCTGCGDCCRGFAREKTDWEPQAGPLLRLSDEPGLPLMSWERHRMLALAEERGLALDVQPFDAVLDAQGQRVVVLSYRLAALACPFLEERPDLPAGGRSLAWGFARGGVCGVYAHRPLACRAYPLVPLRDGIALSIHCPELLDADPASPAELDRVYGDSAASARAFQAAPQLAVHVLRELERAGHVRVVRDAHAGGAENEQALARWPRVDLCELAAAHGFPGWQDLEREARGSGAP